MLTFNDNVTSQTITPTGYQITDAPTISDVKPGQQSDPGVYNPLSIRLTGLDQQAGAGVSFAGHAFTLYDDGTGGSAPASPLDTSYIASGGQPAVGTIVSDKDGGFDYLYWDQAAGTLETLPLGGAIGSRDAQLTLNGLLLSKQTLDNSSIEFIGTDGQPATDLEPVSIDDLLAFINDPTTPLDPLSMAKVRLYGASAADKVTLQSQDSPTDVVDLLMPGATSNLTRTANLVAHQGYAESDKWVVIYEPSQDAQQLTDAQWQALAADGVIAVHNARIDAKSAEKAAEVVTKYHDHHLFSLFRGNAQYEGFWKEVFGKGFSSHDSQCLSRRVSMLVRRAE